VGTKKPSPGTGAPATPSSANPRPVVEAVRVVGGAGSNVMRPEPGARGLSPSPPSTAVDDLVEVAVPEGGRQRDRRSRARRDRHPRPRRAHGRREQARRAAPRKQLDALPGGTGLRSAGGLVIGLRMPPSWPNRLQRAPAMRGRDQGRFRPRSSAAGDVERGAKSHGTGFLLPPPVQHRAERSANADRVVRRGKRLGQ